MVLSSLLNELYVSPGLINKREFDYVVFRK